MRKALAMTLVICVVGCRSGPENLIQVAPSAYSREQVHAICKSEALNVGAAVRAANPAPEYQPLPPPAPRYRTTCNNIGGMVSCDTGRLPAGFGRGFAEGFNRSYRPGGASGWTDTRAAYEACAAKLGFLRQAKKG